MPHSLLIAAVQLPAAEALAEALRGLGWPVTHATRCDTLVREAVRLAPDVVIVVADNADADLLEAIAALRDAAPRPLLLATRDVALSRVAALVAAGVHEWRTPPGGADDWSRWLALAAARFEHERAQREALGDARARLDERKWIDRAKGVLMRSQQVSEDEAFVLLRTASMHANLRVGEVSRGVTEAAQAADAINRAGQLRMLSQRIVKALALREAGIERDAAEAVLAESRNRAQAHVERLAGVGAEAATRDAWASLSALVDAHVAPTLARADACAEQLLDAADALTLALEQSAGRHSLHIVNLSGRQRMLSQRMAKQVLLASLRDGGAADDGAALAATRADFDAALRELESAPLATDAIRATLAAARGQWQRLLEGVRMAADAGDRRAGMHALARESEALLASFEQLTSLYEHSMQVLLA
ncbi:MAG: type IV pili methyl-accepting chemotaxis transducer N-terminal domain-containing protein [Burkholderiales bacterium]|nr:type IV pili methyl-accepting chemotaxis transducer N-terminal domain-containing protein [Burkholderiales bacterium]